MEKQDNYNSAADRDIHLIRPSLNENDIEFQKKDELDSASRKKRGLRTLHTLELMAVNIYRYQITGEPDEMNRHLIAAMINEMTHLQDFQRKLFEYGWKPSRLRWAYWIVGFLFGTFSRALGTAARLRTGIWVETKAVHHYNQLLEQIEWDEETRGIIEKNRDDESRHIRQWKSLMESM